MTESPTKAITTIADLLRGVRVELCGRTATILGFTGAERFHELRVLVDATGEEESWWVGNLKLIPIVKETRSENNIEIGGTLGKRVTLPEDGVLEICWRQPHGAVSFWQLRNHPHIGSCGLNKHGRDFIDDLEAALVEAQNKNERLQAQAIEISTALSDAGFGPCPLPEAVRRALRVNHKHERTDRP